MATDDRRLSTRSRANPGGMDVLSVLGPDVRPLRERKPPWFKVPAPGGARYRELTKLIKDEELHTVCQEAACPNVGECWERGTATFMILGDTCTRRCGFCNVRSGKPTWNDPLEPLRVARSVAKMGLRHAVITSVDRDDLPDYGAGVWVGVIRSIRMQAPWCKVECLTPDFRGEEMPLAKVIAERPDVFNHNVEVVPRLYPVARRGSRWERSLRVLRNAREMAGDELVTKSGLMVGRGVRPRLRAHRRRPARALELPRRRARQTGAAGRRATGRLVFPLRDNIPTDRFPVLTVTFIALNVLVYFFLQDGRLGLPESALAGDWPVATYSAIPCEFTGADPCRTAPGGPPTIATAFTAMFMHGSILHLGGNMLFLWIFGNNVEDSMGPIRYLVFYLLGGLAALAAQAATDVSSE